MPSRQPKSEFEPLLTSVSGALQILGGAVGRSTLNKLLYNGEIESVVIGKKRCPNVASVKKFASTGGGKSLCPPEKRGRVAEGTDMSGGKASRQKGNRLERAIVRLLQDAGFAAEKVPLSGSCGGSFCGDLILSLFGRDLRIEAKARGNGFASPKLSRPLSTHERRQH
jgi:hypothetical protein